MRTRRPRRSFAIMRARQPSARATSGARTSVISCETAKRQRAARLRKRSRHLAPQAPGRLGEKQRTEDVGQPRVDLVAPCGDAIPAPASTRGSGTAVRSGCAAAKRSATRPPNEMPQTIARSIPAPIERAAHLIDVVIEAHACASNAKSARRLVAERKRDDAKGGGQRLDRGPMYSHRPWMPGINTSAGPSAVVRSMCTRIQFLKRLFPVFRVY